MPTVPFQRGIRLLHKFLGMPPKIDPLSNLSLYNPLWRENLLISPEIHFVWIKRGILSFLPRFENDVQWNVYNVTF